MILRPRSNVLKRLFRITGAKLRLVQALSLANQSHGAQTGWQE